MKTRNSFLKVSLIIATVAMMMLTTQFLVGQDWYNTSWQYRRLVNVPNPGATTLTDYQVKINLISPAFDFNNAKTDGSDIRLTASDGVTLIPYWIEEWTFGSQATIWVKVPSISVTGIIVYLYYGNSGATSISNANTVFDFYDGFDESPLNMTKWSFMSGNSGQTNVSDGNLTLTGSNGAFVAIKTMSSFGMNYLFENRAKHPDQGTPMKVVEFGFNTSFGDIVRIVDDFPPPAIIPSYTTTWNRQSKLSGQTGEPGWQAMGGTANQDWHIFRIFRQGTNTAGYQIDNSTIETTTSSVPTSSLSVFLMSYTESTANNLIVDWTRVRKWVGSDPATTVGPEKTNCPDTPVASATAQPNCTVATGTITVTSPTGTGITYSINEGPYQSSPVFSGLIPGIYYVKAKNSVPCISPPSSAITINPQPLTPDQPTASVTQPICTAPTGTITVTSPIGSGMTYSIGGAYQPGLEFSGLNPGLYYLTAKNSSGCISPAAAVTVNAVTGAPEAPTATVVQPDCNLSTGTITITAPLAEGMEYSKDGINYSTNKIFSGLIPGSYNLTAKNATGCISPITSVIINSPPSNNLDTWYNADWPYRRAFSVTNPGGTALTDYQLLITLSNSFEFSKTKTDGSDIRFTSNDGKTALPYWIETWNPSGQQANIWVKVPSIPIAGTSIFLYYGNPTPTIDLPIPVEVPPTGPFTRAAGNPIIPSGATGSSLLAENIVYDDVTHHYWMCLANYSQAAISLCYSDNPTNPGAWVWSGNVITSFTSYYSGAPHLLKNGSTWYLFYADRPNIRVATATNVAGPYTINPTPVLSPSGPSPAWDNFRVDEPYVFYRESDSKWILVYMGDSGGATEQVGYATANNITGPYTAFAGNPCLKFGLPGSFDAGTIADPWVYKYHDVYYIGYTVSSTNASPWQTACATTTDWLTFTKLGVIFPIASSGWDAVNSFRGAVTRVGDNYVFSYTGDGYQMGIATQPVYVTPSSIFNNVAAVFDFYDGFDGTQLDGTKWSISKLFAQTGSASVNNGFLTLRANSNPSSDLIIMTGNSSFGPGYLLEAYARHSDANGSGTNASELGFGNASRTNILRILDYNSSKFIKNNTANNNGENDYSNLMAHNLDNINFLLHKIYWKSNSDVDYAIGTDAFEPLTTNIPSVTLPPWLMCAALPNQATLLVDWIRVRKKALVEPTTTIELEQNQTPPAQPVAVVSSQPTCTVAKGTITVTSSLVGLHFSIDGSDYTNSTGIFTLVLPGNYTVTSKNSDGCISAPSATITINLQPETPNQPSAEVTPLTCAIPFGTIIVTSSTEGLLFSIDGSNYTNTNGIFTGLNPGTYNLTAKNNSGCVSPAAILVIDPLADIPAAPSVSVTQPTCYVATGTITVTAPLGNGLTYSINGNIYTSNTLFTLLAPGSYSVTAKSDAGCISSSTLVTINPPLGGNLETWYNVNWPYRRSVNVTNSGVTALTNYQVMITLSSSFDFSKAKNDGSDIRVTSGDGTTLIPFWIETWNPPSSANIWVKVPSIPVAGTTIYLYYGNPTPIIIPPTPVETPPIGPYTKSPSNPFLISGQCQNNILPENLVFEGGKYWVLVTDRCINGGVISLVSSTDLTNWTYEGVILSGSLLNEPGRTLDSPCILKANGIWYLFYSNFYGSWNFADPAPIGIAKSSSANILGPYTEIKRDIVLTGAPGSWDGARVSEPYVIQRDNGDWVIVYMGDADPAGGFTEQVGIAVSTTGIEGPYTKSSGNPVIAFGPPGSIDAGTIADPWVVKFGSTYYIGYTASPSKAGWNTSYATTTDWITYTKSNTIILNQGPGAYDQASAFRGAVTRVNDTYIFPYTGQGSGGFQFGLATQPVYMTTPSIINNADAVFDFYDAFDGTQLQTTKWNISKSFAQMGTATVNNGILTVRSYTNSSNDIITLTGNANFGPGYLLESLARHSDANGSGTTAAELGFGNAARTDMLRIFDYSSPTKFTKNATANSVGGMDFGNLMAHDLDNTNYLLHKIYWKSSSEARYALEADAFEPITTNIPSISLPPWIMCASLTNQATLMVDWIRVRKMALMEPTSSISLEQNQTPPATPVAIVSLHPTCSVPTGTITVTSSIVGLHFSIDGSTYTNTNGIFSSMPPGNYNVTAMNSDGCISAPSNTVTLIQPGCATVNGILKYFNSGYTLLPNVSIKLKQYGVDKYVTAPTGLSGEYSFTNVAPGTYDVEATTDNTVGGINVTDAAQTNYWGVFFGDIEKVRFYAGDVVMNNLIDGTDASRILQYFLTQGSTNWVGRPAWTFWNVGETIGGNPASGNFPTITVASSNITQNLYGLVTGDFNQSFVPGSMKAGSESLSLIYGENISVIPDMEFDLPLSAAMDMEVGAVSLIMNFPSDLLEVNAVYLSDDPNTQLMYSVSGDELRIGWNSLEPISLLEGESLLTLNVKVIGLPGEEGIRFKLAADPLNELADGSYDVISNAVLSIDIVKTVTTGTGEISLSERLTLSNHPNPFKGTTNFVYTLPADGKVTLEIYDIVGNKVKSLVDETQPAGDYVLPMDEAVLQPGVYTATIKLKNNDTLITRTIKIISKY